MIDRSDIKRAAERRQAGQLKRLCARMNQMQREHHADRPTNDSIGAASSGDEVAVLSASFIERHRVRRQESAIHRLAERAQRLPSPAGDQDLPLSRLPDEKESAERDPAADRESSELGKGAKQ
tara:strand:+ start:3031 stop:3399 length:369 start_codon:yes stop_codon:yes gene_type:complete